jgi:hypothetical protein
VNRTSSDFPTPTFTTVVTVEILPPVLEAPGEAIFSPFLFLLHDY